MNTYRTYILDTTDANKPAVHVVYAQGNKYGDAWKAARASVSGKTVEGAEKDGIPKLFTDADGKVDAKLGHGDHITVAKIVDIRERNKKVDKDALKGILSGAGTAEQKLAAAMQALGGR